jgi:predicted transcriptional regulator
MTLFTVVLLGDLPNGGMKYRGKIDITSQILDAANCGGVTKSRIAFRAILNFDQLKENLSVLVEKDLLRQDKNAQTFKTT